MPTPDKPTYTHGSIGTQPPSARDYATGDPLDADEFDYLVNESFETVKDVIDFLDQLDSDGDGTVDAAEQADQAATAAALKGNDIDSDGDGIVDEADVADQARRAEVRTNDPPSPADGRMWIRSDL